MSRERGMRAVDRSIGDTTDERTDAFQAEPNARDRARPNARDRAPSPDREMEVLLERFERDAGTIDRMVRLKLTIPEDIVEQYGANWHLRWINDDAGRVHDLTRNDFYVAVDEVEPVPVGRSPEGKPIYARLFKKPLHIMRAQRAAKESRIGEQEKGLMSSPKSSPEDTRSDAHSYVPSGNRID